MKTLACVALALATGACAASDEPAADGEIDVPVANSKADGQAQVAIAEGHYKTLRFTTTDAPVDVSVYCGISANPDIVGTQFEVTSTDLGIEAAHMLRLRDRLYKLMGEYTGKDYDTIKRDFDRNKWLFAEEAVTFTGTIATIEKVADSGNTVERGFCPQCGSQIYSKTLQPSGLPMRIRAGTLDDPELMPPQAIIWTDSAPRWALLDPALPHHARGPK